MDRRGTSFGALNGKFGARSDAETDSNERPRRRIDEEDSEARPRKDYDRPKWNNRDSQIDSEKLDDLSIRNARDASSREKYSQPWTRKEKPLEQEDNRRESPAWRRGQREREFERQDAEPEWVDSLETPEPAKQHTHEDFLRWKESMTGRPTGDSRPTPSEEQQEKVVEIITSQPRIVSDPIASGDKFFAKFEENKGNARPTKSRFANIFGPKEQAKAEMEGPTSTLIPVAQPAELEQPAPPSAEPEKKVDADFAKLLAMLGKNEGPQAANKSRPPRSPLNLAELASTRSPDLPANNALPQSTRTPMATHSPQLSLDRLIESRSPAHHERAPQAKSGAQELLELLQRSNLQDRQEQRQPTYLQQEQRVVPPPPGLSGYHDRDRSGPALISTRREASRSIFDDPAFVGYRAEPQQFKPLPTNTQRDHGGLENLFAAMNKGYAAHGLHEQRPTPNQQVPPGLQRPPGLDSRPPPGWSGNPPPPPPPPQRQSSQHVPNYNPGPQQNLFNNQNQPTYGPQQQSQQQQREQQRLPQRKLTSDMPGFVNYPPPGFGPSPPYASPASPDQYGAMRSDYGLPDRIAARERLERPPPQQNPFAAMYGGTNNGRGNGGGVQLPPGFR